jgi:hypothetical protein
MYMTGPNGRQRLVHLETMAKEGKKAHVIGSTCRCKQDRMSQTVSLAAYCRFLTMRAAHGVSDRPSKNLDIDAIEIEHLYDKLQTDKRGNHTASMMLTTPMKKRDKILEVCLPGKTARVSDCWTTGVLGRW